MQHLITYFSTACFLLLFNSCKKEQFNINNLNGDKISVFGHGGMGIGQSYPMNSLESILNCLYLGADGTEIDVQMTKDGVLVAFHDETLEESTNLKGRIYDKNWSEIKEARYKYPMFSNYKIIKLETLFKLIPHQDQYSYFLDCKNFEPNKDSSYISRFNNSLIKIIDQYNLQSSTYVEFKNEALIAALKDIRPDIKQFIYSYYHEAFSLAEKYNLEGLTIEITNLTHKRIQELHNAGIMVATFNTHSHKRNIEAVKYNVDFIQTDRVKHLIKILK
ncbi:hypothetical protein CW751_05515 [Brumimicrobium salinarum]|uniref:GP-PDE domain-containing protein n=1 Tax=Brumimicrobium salinarum TaxID=2058658 RepID=A0A2I0R3X7_9FLAO|nr:glycerophosphodiester phosphodiesterase family protein [Brumimicrobium salinarum]PKR81278.1 hypothetical protein CW751_05515 [Brumimicrobium salinarum]